MDHQPARGLGVSLEGYNLLNRAYKTHGSGIYNPGRSLWVTVTAELGKG